MSAAFPETLTTDDIATALKVDVDQARKLMRRHKDILKPFKLGRENRVTAESFEIFTHLLIHNKLG
jgi:hypothetical protein